MLNCVHAHNNSFISLAVIFFPIQCVFLVWCFLPISWNGSHILYYRFIRPFILRHQDRIDSALDGAKKAVDEGMFLVVLFIFICSLASPSVYIYYFNLHNAYKLVSKHRLPHDILH